VTMVGVVGVVDSGRARQLQFDPATGVAHLETVDISQASADQRAGRAGRTEAGVALRLWTRDAHRTRIAHDIPEIRRSDLSSMVLRVLDLGADLSALPWLEAPPEAAVTRAFRVLDAMGAVGPEGLTARGRELAALPIPPRTGAVVLRGRALGGVRSAATAAALLSEGSPWSGAHEAGLDLAELVDRVEDGARHGARRKLEMVKKVRDQLVRAVGCGDGRRLSDADLVDCLLAGYPDRLARRRAPGDTRFKLASGRGATLRQPEVLPHGDFCIAVELQGRGRGGARSDIIHLAAAVPETVLQEQSRWTLQLRFDADSERVQALEVASIGLLELETRPPVCRVSDEQVTEVLVAAAASRLDSVLCLSDDALAWLARARFVAHHRPDLELPTFRPPELLAVVRQMATGCRSFADIRARGVLTHLKAQLSWPQQQAIESLAPESITLPTGSRRRLTYGEPDRPPVLAARMQQLFGCTQTPRVLGGRVPVLLHLLAPNNRPAQVTADLASFWENTWGEVRKDLRGRYPKHAWPEDPRTAEPEDRPRRKRS